MNKKIDVNVSVLCADFARLKEEIHLAEEAGVDRFHIDVMDGHFVPNITIGPVLVAAMRPHTQKPLDVHLMIEHPWDYIDAFIDAGADILGLQVECYGQRRAACAEYGQWPKEVDSIDTTKMRADIKRIQARGVKAYAVVNPGTPLCFDELYEILDGVLIMSVNPGFAKQAFIPEVLTKIATLDQHFKGEIAVDGGVNAQTAPDAVKAGAHILITASYFYGADDKKQVVQQLGQLGV